MQLRAWIGVNLLPRPPPPWPTTQGAATSSAPCHGSPPPTPPAPSSPLPHSRLIPKVAPSLSHRSGPDDHWTKLDTTLPVLDGWNILWPSHIQVECHWMCPVKPAAFEHCKRRYGSPNPDVLGSAGAKGVQSKSGGGQGGSALGHATNGR